jgi:hypothetical protein
VFERVCPEKAFALACAANEVTAVARLAPNVSPRSLIRAFTAALTQANLPLADALWPWTDERKMLVCLDRRLSDVIAADQPLTLAWLLQKVAEVTPHAGERRLDNAIKTAVTIGRWDILNRLLIAHRRHGLASLGQIYTVALLKAWEVQPTWVPRLWPHAKMGARVRLVWQELRHHNGRRLGNWLDQRTCTTTITEVMYSLKNQEFFCLPNSIPEIPPKGKRHLFEGGPEAVYLEGLLPFMNPASRAWWLAQVEPVQFPRLLTACRAEQICQHPAHHSALLPTRHRA